jgi:hypothetical protein
MSKNEKLILLSVIVVASILVAGCAATVPVMPDHLDATAKEFSPPAGKANLYITRTDGLGIAVLFKVHLDGKLVGSIAADTYLLFEVEPETNQVAVITEESQDALEIDVEAGKTYFIDVVPKWGWKHARAGLNQLTEENGKAAVRGAKRAKPLIIGH